MSKQQEENKQDKKPKQKSDPKSTARVFYNARKAVGKAKRVLWSYGIKAMADNAKLNALRAKFSVGEREWARLVEVRRSTLSAEGDFKSGQQRAKADREARRKLAEQRQRSLRKSNRKPPAKTGDGHRQR